MAGCRVNFLLSALNALRVDLADLNIPLQVLFCTKFDQVPEQLRRFCELQAIDTVFWNREYPLDEVRRDRKVENHLAVEGIKVRGFDDRMLLPPDSILTHAGTPYKVFTPYRRQVWSHLEMGLPSLLPAPKKQAQLTKRFPLNAIPTSLPGFNSHIDSSIWTAGEKVAKAKLESFVEGGIEDYQENRDIPALDGTSSLSPYLAIGNLSPQQCLFAALSGSAGVGRETWVSEILWRDFYQYVVWHFPQVCKYRPFNKQTEDLQWRQSEIDFKAWCRGQTGVPLVDAGMRQLQTTGWMHNRVRMVVAMFLAKNLLLDWRLGERFFMQHLIDGDFAANNGGWQWSASTGTDAAPYFRVFNPFLQAEKFDPEAIYIKRYVPELKGMEAKDIHKPLRLQKGKPETYPDVIVNINSSRERAISAFKNHQKR